MLKNKYEYPNLKRIQTKQGRRYVGEDEKPVPSVTTILGDTGDKSALIAWRKRVGEAEATRISTESAGLGTKVHNALEKYILQEDYEIKGNNHISIMAKNMVTEMIDKGLSKVDELYGVEVGLIAEGLYAFKTSKKIKKREWIEDYFMQGCAYALAHNEMFGSNIQTVAILMIDREGKYADFVIEGEEFNDYCDKWSSRLADYYSK